MITHFIAQLFFFWNFLVIGIKLIVRTQCHDVIQWFAKLSCKNKIEKIIITTRTISIRLGIKIGFDYKQTFTEIVMENILNKLLNKQLVVDPNGVFFLLNVINLF